MKAFAAIAAALACLLPASRADAASVAVYARPGYYAALGGHVRRWLSGHGIPSDLVSGDAIKSIPADVKMAFLVGVTEPSAQEVAAIKAFRSRGGKLVVFYSASPALGALMGVKPLGYKAAPYPGCWSRMDFDVKSLAGCPASILQTSTVLQRAAPVKGRGFVMARWRDRAGKDVGDAAWIATDAGFWMTHVFTADGDEELKAQLLAAMAGSVVPGLWNYREFLAGDLERRRQTKAFALRQVPKAGEIHAVWEHSGCGLYPGDWSRTIRLLKESRVTDLFVNVAGAGFAHYPSSVLPRSRTFAQEGDQLAACLAAAKGSGIRVHAWILCFTATRGSPAVLEDFGRKGWRLKTPQGALTEYLDPSHAAVRAHVLGAITEIQSKYRVDGIHLDFVRWYERSVRPADAAKHVSSFVLEARRRVKRPLWLTAAVLGKYPSCVAAVGQDWVGWIDSNTVDYVVPMDYTESDARFETFVRQHAESRRRASKVIAGIGVTANESRLDAKQVIGQINIARRHGLAGVALFDLDTTLEKSILPYLRLGIW